MTPENTTIVLGGPGAGKTSKLLSITEEALASGVRPDKIGFVSFTKKAAEEGKSRACERFGIRPDDLPHFRTLHSMAFKHLGMRRDQVVGWTHMRELGKMLGIEFKGRGGVADGDVYGMNSADRMVFLEGLARNTRKSLHTVWGEAFEDAIDWWELERFARTLQSFKKNRHLTDFTDMLEMFCATDPSTLPGFELLIVDEAQDLSSLQWEAVELLARRAKKIYVAGDDCQAIYLWSGANVEHFINLPGDQVTLEQSFRIPLSVHRLAEELSNKISSKRSRTWKAREEIGSVNWFRNMEEVDLSTGTWLLLARNGYMLDELENWCMSQGFSFHSVNRDPLKSPALQAVRVWENLRRGQEESAERVLETLRYANPRAVPETLTKKLKASEASRMYAMAELKALGLGTEAIWHEALTRIGPKERDFFVAARRRGEALLKEPRITISTIHASKGGQADHVLLLTDMSYRCNSNMMANPDDEIRVWYVAATRCRQSLNLIMPKTTLNFAF